MKPRRRETNYCLPILMLQAILDQVPKFSFSHSILHPPSPCSRSNKGPRVPDLSALSCLPALIFLYASPSLGRWRPSQPHPPRLFHSPPQPHRKDLLVPVHSELGSYAVYRDCGGYEFLKGGRLLYTILAHRRVLVS